MQDMALQTLFALEQRLERLSLLLHGDSIQDNQDDGEPSSDSSASITSRLQSLEKSLQSIASHSSSAAELLLLQKQHPRIWKDETSTDASRDAVDDIPNDALAALVLAHTPSYHTTAAQLTSLNDLPLPDTSSSTNLLALQPRIQKAKRRQERQMEAISLLREQSVALLGRWYELGIVGIGDCWTECDARLTNAETVVRRAEAKKRHEEENAI
ncbi:hypothetical protein AAFC00_000366 [Neodothiora populina]|uniref:RO-10 protein, required for nuclear distribution n=1 Tax=Neodothiora populina TaxID=2781224 RepID=A0ABR3PCM3_9PEZI